MFFNNESDYYLFKSDWVESPKCLPENLNLFAVGDVHGQLNLLIELQKVLVEESKACESPIKNKIVYLGDYIDRGHDSPGVLKHLGSGLGEANIEEVFLKGNHDHYLLRVLEKNSVYTHLVPFWMEYGGSETLEQLGVPWEPRFEFDWLEFTDSVRNALGKKAVDFLVNLENYHTENDYLFVHAGVNPSIGFEENDLTDLLTVREPFLSWSKQWPFDFCVVHGHTPACPTVKEHRIGVDSGAYFSNALAAVQLLGNKSRFVVVTHHEDDCWSRMLNCECPWHLSKQL